MGQALSNQPTDGLNRASLNQGPLRRYSEPPASTSGGHTVCQIPEDEEVNAKTTEIQYADWKKASGASGILKEKSRYHQQQGGVTAPGSPAEGAGGGSASVSKRTRARSIDYRHLADFSMFPDKFSMPNVAPKPQLDGTQSTKPPTSLSAALFGLRTGAFSTSETNEDIQELSSDSKDLPSRQPQGRKRSASFGGRLPFFDFSMIPDKDPNYQEMPRRGSTSKPEPTKANDCPTIVVQPASVVAAALTMAANSNAGKTPTKPASPKKTGSPPPRFTFFDYSMCPDKDPRANMGQPPRKGD